MQISNYLSAAILNAVLRNTGYVSPNVVYAALYTSDPTSADTGIEVSGGAYTRQAISFSPPILSSNQQAVSNSADVIFPVATTDWGLVTHVGIRDAASGGNLLWSVPLVTPRTVLAGDRLKYVLGSVQVSFIQ